MSNNAVRRGQPSSPKSNRRPSHGNFVSRIPTYTPVGGSTQVLEQVQEMSDYPWLFTQPFADPLETLCHAYGLEKATTQLSAGHEVPHTINMPLLDEVSQDLRFLDEPPPTPTHALVIVSNDPNASSPPIIAPINDIVFSTTFTYDITRQYPCSNDDPPPPAPAPPDSERGVPPPPPPIEIANDSEERQTIVLPTVVLAAAHPPSVPVILLFAMAPFLPAMYRPPLSLPPSHVTTPFHSRSPTLSPASTPPLSPAATPPPSPPPPIRRFLPPPQYPIPPGLFPTYLLPTFVIEELPGYPTAVNMMARNCTWEELDAWAAYSFGVWGNLLVLNPKSDELRVHVQLSMKLTSDARKTRRYMDARRAEAKAKAKAAARES